MRKRQVTRQLTAGLILALSVASTLPALAVKPSTKQATSSNQPAMPIIHKLSDYTVNGHDFSLYAALDPASSELNSVDGAVRQAWADYQNGRTASTTMTLKNYLEKNPDDAVAHYLLAYVYAADDNPDAAAEELEKTIALNPKFMPAYISLSQLYLGARNYAQADQIIAKGRSQWPQQVELAVAQGDLFEAYGERDKAKQAYLQALKLDPYHANAHTQLGGLYMRAENYGAAEAELKTAIALAPDNQYALKTLAETYQRWNKSDKAAVVYAQLLNPAALVAHARSLQKAKHPQEAVAVLKTVETLPSGKPNPVLAFDMGMLYADLKEPMKAQRLLQEFIQSNTTPGDVRLTEARERLKELSSAAPANPPASTPTTDATPKNTPPTDESELPE